MLTKNGVKLSEKDMARALLMRGILGVVDTLEDDLRERMKVLTKGQLEKVNKHVDGFVERFQKTLIKGGNAEVLKEYLGL